VSSRAAHRPRMPRPLAAISDFLNRAADNQAHGVDERRKADLRHAKRTPVRGCRAEDLLKQQ
jgi:hypothetical protein